MALKPVIDTIEGLDTGVAALYTKGQDGKYRLDIEGGIPDVTNLNKALRSEREAREAAERAAKQFEGLDPQEVRSLMDQMAGNEELQLVKAGKLPELKAKWTEKMSQEAAKQVKAAQDAQAASDARAAKWTGKVLDNAIRTAAAPLLHSYAVDDALLAARQLFTLDDEGNAVQLGEDGKPVLGKDGKTLFSPTEWLESMRETKPHWFPATATGGGARPGGNGQGGKTMKRSAFDALPPTQRSKLMREGVTLYD